MTSRNLGAALALFAFAFCFTLSPATFDLTTLSLHDGSAWAKPDKVKEKSKKEKDTKKEKQAKKDKKAKKEKSCSKDDQNCNDLNEKSKKGGKSEEMKGKGKEK